MGIVYKISFMVFLWTFSILIVIMVEGIFDQKNRSLIDRTIFAFGLIAVFFVTFPNVDQVINAETNPVYALALGLLFSLKLALIPISEVTIGFSENILVPKNVQTEEVLQDQIDRLKSTNYEIDTESEFNESLQKLRGSIIFPFIISISFILALSIIGIFANQGIVLIRDFIIVLIVLLSGIALSSIMFIDYLEKRKLKKKEEQEIEIYNEEEEEEKFTN